LEREPVSPASLAQACIDSVASLAKEHKTPIAMRAPGGHVLVDLDPRRIRRILVNFLSNAIDHGEGKPIEVWVDSNSDAIAFAVRDHGVGMTADETERVFDRFWRADPSRQRKTGGTGLGLAIAAGDARVHGGFIDVWSAPGEGACFRLTIPRPGAVDVTSPLALPPIEEDDRA
jgi:two-component system sensor histidine kinase MtrB